MKSSWTRVVTIYRCLRCRHEWQPRFQKRPGVCPACKRYDWDTPKPARPS